jgi:RNA polymerase sigma-70 factor (ECF subfamily)
MDDGLHHLRSSAAARTARPAAAPRAAAAPWHDEETFARVLDAARANGEWAWQAIYRAYAPALLGYLRSQGAASPEDVLGETFLAVVRSCGRFSGSERAFRAWLYRIATNRLVDARRAERARPVVAGASDAAEPVDEGAATPFAAEALSVLGVLPADQRAVLYLRLVLDLSHAEIADALGKRVGAVKMLQRRALDRLARDPDARRYLLGRPSA